MIYVCSLDAMPGAVTAYKPSHLISLLDPDHVVATPPGMAAGNHLKLGMHDISQPFMGYVAPEAEHIQDLLDFGAGWPRAAPLLVHCFAGVSRSMAAALLVMCQRNAGREREAARVLHAHAPHAMPNRRMIALGDKLLGLEGRLVEAVRTMPPPDLTTLGEPAAVPVEF